MLEPQIIAMGGGGFRMEPTNLLLDQYVVDAVRASHGVDRPRICFIPTASGDSESYTLDFYKAYTELGCEPCHLELFRRSVSELQALIDGCHAVHVGGGNTANLLALWRLHGLDDVLHAAWQNGVLMTGMSAGANCWFEGCTTDSFGQGLVAMADGLGFLEGTVSPHYDGEAERRPTYQRLIAEGMAGGIALDDGVAAHFTGTTLNTVVSSRQAAGGWRVGLDDDGSVAETPLEVRYLG